MKKLFACVICVVLLCTVLSACGDNRADNDGLLNDLPAATAQVSPDLSPDLSPDMSPDIEDGIVDDKDGIIYDDDTIGTGSAAGNGSAAGTGTAVNPSPAVSANP